jgi:hypothetical protein
MTKYGEWSYTSTAVDGGEWSASRPGRFTQGKKSPIPIGWEAAWVPEPVWMLWNKGKSVAMLGIEPSFPVNPAHGLVTIPAYVSRSPYITWAKIKINIQNRNYILTYREING